MNTGARELNEGDFPGYREAVARESLVRMAAVMGFRERVCGREVLPLTSRHVRWLQFAGSPFLIHEAKAEDLLAKRDIDADVQRMLWIISPRFQPEHERRRKRFYRASGKLVDSEAKLRQAVAELLEYVAEAYLDAPPMAESNARSYYALEMDIVLQLNKEFGLPVDFWETSRLRNWFRRIIGKPSPLDVPLKIYWQLNRVLRRYNDPDAVMSNRSCQVLADGLVQINERAQREHKLHQYVTDLAKPIEKAAPKIELPPGRNDGWEYGLN